MRLKKHQVQIVMPEPLHDILSITYTNEQGLIYVLQRVSPTVMTNMHSKNEASGILHLWCLDQDRKVMFYPRPEKEYNLRIEYLPPSKVV